MNTEVSKQEFELLRKRVDLLEQRIITLLRYTYRNDLANRRILYLYNTAIFPSYVPSAQIQVYSLNGKTMAFGSAKVNDVMAPAWERISSNAYLSSPV